MLFLDARQPRPLGRSGRSARRQRAAPGDARRRSPTSTTTTPATCPTAGSCSARRRCFQACPAWAAATTVANLCIMNADGTGVRQLCFDQDHDWCPTVLNDGRVLYTRWEYSDIAALLHAAAVPHEPRRHGPDGLLQAATPTGRTRPSTPSPIPGHPTKVVAVISGHHGVARMGELVIFDPAKGRHEAEGVVQRIPGYGQKVEPIIGDGLVDGSWPKFLHPCPLSDKYFLVSMPAHAAIEVGHLPGRRFRQHDARQGGRRLRPLRARSPCARRPGRRVIPDRVDLTKQDATVYLADVYAGPGLAGRAPRHGQEAAALRTALRLSGHGRAHQHRHRRPLGRASHPGHRAGRGRRLGQLPACRPTRPSPCSRWTPRARPCRLMRSWFTAMPGEVVSCVGCHETQNSTPPTRADHRQPAQAVARSRPGTGRRGASVSSARCSRCWTSTASAATRRPHSRTTARPCPTSPAKPSKMRLDAHFTPSYIALHPFVRRPGPESDYHLQRPLEYHADTSELVQMLSAGHHNVKLDAEAWDRLDHLDRPERARPRHVDGARRRPAARHGAAAGDAREVRQPHGRSGEDPGRPAARSRSSSSPPRRCPSASRRRSAWPAGLSTPPRRPGGRRPRDCRRS